MNEFNSTERQPVTLTPRELEAMEAEIRQELQRLGTRPTLNELMRQGYQEHGLLNLVLDTISGVGRIINLLIVELIQSVAALFLVILFSILEYWRVYDGALVLGQTESQASLIGYAIVAANVVVPIWMIRQLRGRSSFSIRHKTIRGYATDFWYRLTGRPRTEEADLYYNPTLNFATMIVTNLTIVIAAYNVLGPLVTSIFEGKASRPLPILIWEMLIGLMLSLAGVFFLQSAAHAMGARTLIDNPRRLSDLLETQRIAYDKQVEAIRIETRERYEAAKAARLQARTSATIETPQPRQLTAVSKVVRDKTKRRNRNAQADLAEWFKSQPPEIFEQALSGQLSLRQIGDMAGVDKEIVRRYLAAVKLATIPSSPSPNGNGNHTHSEL